MSSVAITGHFHCVKKFNNWYWVHGVRQSRLYLDLKPKCPFWDMLCHLLVVVRESVCKAIGMESHGFSETIVKWTEYFNFVFLMNAPLCQLVGLARTSVEQLPWAVHRIFRWGLWLNLPVHTFAALQGRGYPVMWHILAILFFAFRGVIFLSPSDLLSADGAHGVSMWDSSLGDVVLESVS